MRSPPSPELVDRRFAELQQLSRLGASLLEAELPPIDRRVLERRSLRVIARTGDGGSDWRDLRLYVSSTAVDRQLGWMPDAWVDPMSGLVVGAGLTVLAAAFVNEQSVDALPRGRDGMITLRFLAARPECVDTLPLLDRSDQRPRLWLCSNRDRARTQW
jgi:hypothetical protein